MTRRVRRAVLTISASLPLLVPTMSAGEATAARPFPELASASLTAVATGLPATTSAALVNITMVDGTAPGYITADACSRLSAGPQSKSTGNHGALAAAAQLSVVAVDADGRFCIANQSPVELLVDVQGSFAPPAANGQRFSPSKPTRVLDTRSTGRPTAGSVTRVVPNVPAGSAAALVNLTMTSGSVPGFVTADRCSVLGAGPQTRSNGNHPAGAAVSNLNVIALDADGAFCLFNSAPVDLVVDIQGSFAPSSKGGLGFAANPPQRLLDTRTAPSTRPLSGSVTRVDTGLVGAAAALVNVAMANASIPGFITADRCSVLGAGLQTRSNGNHPAGAAVSNLSVVPLDADGSFCIFNLASVDLVVDLQGSFDADATDEYFPALPTRVLDTRPPTPPPPTTPTTRCTSVVHIGDSTSVGMISPSYLADPAERIDAQYRRVGVTTPRMEISGARSIVETLGSQSNARDVAAGLKASGYEGCWVLALGTTDTANIAAGSGPGRRERIDRMMAVIGDDPVMWVNVRTAVGGSDPWSNANMQVWNQALAAAAPSYPNLRIYDWNAAMNPAWLSGDRIHYTSGGYAQRAHLIADALAELWPL